MCLQATLVVVGAGRRRGGRGTIAVRWRPLAAGGSKPAQPAQPALPAAPRGVGLFAATRRAWYRPSQPARRPPPPTKGPRPCLSTRHRDMAYRPGEGKERTHYEVATRAEDHGIMEHEGGPHCLAPRVAPIVGVGDCIIEKGSGSVPATPRLLSRPPRRGSRPRNLAAAQGVPAWFRTKVSLTRRRASAPASARASGGCLSPRLQLLPAPGWPGWGPR